MEISGPLSIKEVWTLHNKQFRSETEIKDYWDTRRQNPELDRALYDYDKAQIFKDLTSADLLKKYILGYDLNDEEKETVNKDNPEILEKASKIKYEQIDLEDKIKNASDSSEIQGLLANSMKEAKENSDDKDYLNLKSQSIRNLANTYLNKNNANSYGPAAGNVQSIFSSLA